jgi:F0F1-type ATP synthase membrane subunit c/vacuolar-type H+-ATPase subunit K
MEPVSIVQNAVDNHQHIILIVKIVSSAVVVACGSFAAAIAQGKIASKACEGMAASNEHSAPGIRQIFIFGVVMVETCAIYCVLLALIFLFLI